MVLGSDYMLDIQVDWLRVRRKLRNARINEDIPEEMRAYIKNFEVLFFLPPEVKVFKDVEGKYFALLPQLELWSDFRRFREFFDFKREFGKARWFTDKEGRKFIYIRRDEIDKYKKRGWEIRIGPRGGIRAYPPEGQQRREEEEFSVPRSFDISRDVFNFIGNIKEKDLRRKLELSALNFMRGDLRVFVEDIRWYMKNKAYKEYADKLLELLFGSREAGLRFIEELINPKKFDAGKAPVGFDVYEDDPFDMFIELYEGILRRLADVVSSNIVSGKYDEYNMKKAIEYIRAVREIFGEDSIQYKLLLKSLKELRNAEEKLKFIMNAKSYEISDDVAKSVAKRVFEKMGSLFGTAPRSIDNFGNFIFSRKVVEKFGKYFSSLVKAFSFFKELGVSDEEAAVLARGYTLMRMWTSSEFREYTGQIERMVHEIEGNDRHLRDIFGSYTYKDAKFLLERGILRKEDLVSWKKVVNEYLRLWRGAGGNEYQKDVPEGKIRVFRGVGLLETVDLISEAILNDGEVVYKGTMYSFSVDRSGAEEFARYNVIFTGLADIDRVYGCWLNASCGMDVKEAEVILSIPHEGMKGRVIVMTPNGMDVFIPGKTKYVRLDEIYGNFFSSVDSIKDKEYAEKLRRKACQALKKYYDEYADESERRRLKAILTFAKC